MTRWKDEEEITAADLVKAAGAKQHNAPEAWQRYQAIVAVGGKARITWQFTGTHTGFYRIKEA
ncbi:hypothetical protein [Labrys neptuniae]